MSLKLWQIAALVVVGIAFGMIFPSRFTAMFPVATLYVFLPALIFEAAWQIDVRIMRQSWRAIALLAFPGVIVTATVVGVLVHYVGLLPIGLALLLGTVLSATDPVAVTAIFRRLPVPKNLATIVECEALLNDAVAVVLYRTILAAFAVGLTVTSASHIAFQALLGTLGGTLLGIAGAYIAAFALRSKVHAGYQVVTTFIAAYAVYFIADRLKWSGIFAAIALGIVLHALERRHVRVQRASGVERAWRIAALLANTILFFLLGATLNAHALLAHLPVIGVTLLAVFVARLLLAYGGLAFIRPRLARGWRTVIRFAGVRGPLSLALALAIPPEFPGRDVVIEATFAVVVVTTLIATLTFEPRIRNLRV